jgi:hypothetical protein
MDLRRVAPGPALLLLATIALAPAPAAHAFTLVRSTCQICTGSGAGDCETGTPVSGRGAMADMSRFWPADGFAFAASSAITTDYVAMSGFARASGTHSPSSGGPFLSSVSRTGRAFGSFWDRLTVGSGGGSGFLRFPMRLTGATVIEWQNGGGGASYGFSCQSYLPSSPTTLGPCVGGNRGFSVSTAFDDVVFIDVPLLFGTEFEFVITFFADATTGYGYGDQSPFTGQAQINFGTEPFPGAIVLDANKQPIPDATISLGESGFDYQAAPEPASLLGGLAAIAWLVPLRRLAGGLPRADCGR